LNNAVFFVHACSHPEPTNFTHPKFPT